MDSLDDEPLLSDHQPVTSDPSNADLDPIVSNEKFKPIFYKRRWYVLTAFCLLASAQSYNWNMWGPVAESAEAAYGWSDAMISLLAAWGPVMFICTIFPFSWLMDAKGLRIACLLSAACICLGTGARCISQKPPLSTWLMNVGQVGVSLAGPIAMAGATVVSARWFPPHQRVTATAIASRAMALGGGLPFIVGPHAVRDVANNTWSNGSSSINSTVATEVRRDIQVLLYAEFGWSAGVFLLLLVYFPSSPPTPPSLAVQARNVSFKAGVRLLIRKKNFWLLGLPYSVAYGMYIGWGACLDVNLKPFGISQRDAGYLGFYGMLSGAVVGVFMARLVDLLSGRTKPVLLFLYTTACGGVLWFTLVCERIAPFSTASLYSSRVISATCMSAMVPLVFETLCETTYPAPEAVTNAVLTLLKNWWCLVFLSVVWLPNIGTGWMNWLLVGASGVCVPMVILFEERHHRLDVDLGGVGGPEPSTNCGTAADDGETNEAVVS